MTRYFQHVFDGPMVVHDHEGVEFPDDETAKSAAAKGLREMLAASLLEGRINPAAFIVVECPLGRPIAVLNFTDVVLVEDRHHL